MRAGIVVNVARADRRRLEAIVADRGAPQKHVWRANIILATADGCGTAEIMRRSGHLLLPMAETSHVDPRRTGACAGCVAGKKMTGNHPRNTGPMRSSQRCGAKTRSGKPCMSPAVAGKKRCRMHGGAQGSGAPRGNKNALKTGGYTREAIEERRQLRALLRQSRMLIQKIE